MGKIAADLQQALAQRALEGAPGCTLARPLAAGDGWAIDDVLGTRGPREWRARSAGAPRARGRARSA